MHPILRIGTPSSYPQGQGNPSPGAWDFSVLVRWSDFKHPSIRRRSHSRLTTRTVACYSSRHQPVPGQTCPFHIKTGNSGVWDAASTVRSLQLRDIARLRALYQQRNFTGYRGRVLYHSSPWAGLRPMLPGSTPSARADPHSRVAFSFRFFCSSLIIR